MNKRRIAIAIAAVFITQAVANGVIFGLIMGRLAIDSSITRPEEQEHVAIYMLSRVLFVSLFVFIFAGWYPRRGVRAGLRYGLIVWLFYSVPMTVGFWSFMRMSDALAGCWIGIGFVENLMSGLVIGLVYRDPRHTPSTAAAPVTAVVPAGSPT
ncbi:MAG TPA: hypothetical protein VJZ71_06465 [Phycisphaerae bacterium]|nr:hypothetical protein [Phycisphaerae bacterium]